MIACRQVTVMILHRCLLYILRSQLQLYVPLWPELLLLAAEFAWSVTHFIYLPASCRQLSLEPLTAGISCFSEHLPSAMTPWTVQFYAWPVRVQQHPYPGGFCQALACGPCRIFFLPLFLEHLCHVINRKKKVVICSFYKWSPYKSNDKKVPEVMEQWLFSNGCEQ